jgi:hypothetical protein
VGKKSRKTSLGRPRGRWEDNIKTDVRQLSCKNGKSIELAVLAVLNLTVLVSQSVI